jgi:RNA polymerase sigma-70 factor, ECF subfamily
MESTDRSHWVQLLQEARAGRSESLGVLLENQRQSLQLLAGAGLQQRLRARVNASDLVQEAFVRATAHFRDFLGQTEEEWSAWLRTILRRCLLRAVQKQVQTRKRNIAREVPLDHSSETLQRLGMPEALLPSPGSSPSTPAQRRELAAALAERLARLPPPLAQVLILRHLRGLPFAEVARQMGRTPGAARLLWFRALKRLRQQPHCENLR